MPVMVSDLQIAQAVSILRTGGLVVFPTETVYGIGADAANPRGLKHLFEAKGRPADHPVIVHVADAGQMGRWAQSVPPEAQRLAEAFWPGPLTLILKRAPNVSDLVTGGQDTVGIRVPRHPVAQQLLRAFGGGIAAPSANLFGRLSPTTADHVRAEMEGRFDMILDGGACEVGIESTIVDLTGPQWRILRPGHVSAGEIARALSQTLPEDAADAARDPSQPRVSGSLAAHYCPMLPTVLMHPDSIEEWVRRNAGKSIAVLSRRRRPRDTRAALWMVAPDSVPEYARALYDTLRWMDRSGCQMIVIEDLPRLPEWAAVRDRVIRAAGATAVPADRVRA